MLSHLVYVSHRKRNCTEQEIEKILQACKRNNSKIDITGVLLYTDTQFVQYLEGEYNTIISLYDKIKADDRHNNTVLVSSAPIKEKCFPSWQMAAKKVDSKIEYVTDISSGDRNVFNSILQGKQQDSARTISVIQKLFK